MPAPRNDYIPRPDAEFLAWANQYVAAVEQWWADQGFDPAGLNELIKARDDWNAAYPAHVQARHAALSATQAKDAFRRAFERQIRPVAALVQASPATSDADRAAMGITVRDTSPSPAPAPASAPRTRIDAPARLTHTLRLADAATPTRRARPRGVARAEVYVALTPPHEPPPASPGAYRYVASVTGGTTTLGFEPAQGGLQAHYLTRWIATSGTPGPWSETASATVAA